MVVAKVSGVSLEDRAKGLEVSEAGALEGVVIGELPMLFRLPKPMRFDASSRKSLLMWHE